MKKIVSALMVTAFVLSAGAVFAAKVTCTVDAVDGDKVTMTCKKADKLKAGDKVSVKAKKKKAIEGC
ncbi:selenite/tellurite reduction operon protein ExtJ [Desulfogranum mediterraneum]|uniref:selenite/tellurite reduction operon protein ExtJ n=1 Tax=Desulfogranum mediterraneum TaxID=160661 RepID=UPI00040612AF|nr:hypothetical protein [Desulfogranum mediterraneum]